MVKHGLVALPNRIDNMLTTCFLICIGFAPDENRNAILHPPSTGHGSRQWRANFWSADALEFNMPRKRKDLTGLIFGRLTAVSYDEEHYQWNCKCSCGSVVVCNGFDLTGGRMKSCGCLKKERTTARNTKHGQAVRGDISSEYSTWVAMKQRAFNPNKRGYSRYGGRGITVCERWLNSFENFYTDMGAKPSPDHSIDRWPDKDGSYEPGNCRWATCEQQQNNREDNHTLTFKGETLSISEWSRRLGFGSGLLLYRVDKAGWSVEKALTTQSLKK